MKSLDIRQSFFDFFEQRHHKKIVSSTLYPHSDPTLLFTNAGMVPFKQYWLEGEGAPFSRATSIQKCLRAGGKKSDLENVGRTLRHHTFFEMLGNFSFGDYFKREAIHYAWDFFAQLGLPSDLLWVSIYKDDDEAYDIWTKDISFPSNRIVRLGRKDNFWGPVGDSGVCGPCSELHIDLPAFKYGKNRTTEFDEESDSFLELWNLVFIQFYENEKGQQRRLEKTGIDTGMGLERLSFVLQDVPNNYMTDLFYPMIEKLSSEYSFSYDPSLDMSLCHIILDHVRALVMALSENLQFSNEGRGYILKRILRRACLACYQLKLDFSCLSSLSQVVIGQYKGIYPELAESSVSTLSRMTSEVESFDDLIQSVDRYIEPSLQKAEKEGVWQGKDLFVLYDTHGVPYDLLSDYAQKRGVVLDEEGFKDELEVQRNRARSSQSKDSWKTDLFAFAMQVSQQDGQQPFYGYDTLEKEAYIRGIWTPEEGQISSISYQDNMDSFWVILSNSVFYGESGGQIGDQGVLQKEGQDCVTVLDAKKTNDGQVILNVSLCQGQLQVGDALMQSVNSSYRSELKQSHTATHLLHSVLRTMYGEQVRQMGSLVACGRLRFDFSCSKESFLREDINQIEERVNQFIFEDILLEVKEQSLEEAKKEGVISFFDEKYGDIVRCVRFGEVSSELCSGTHVSSTGLIGSFYIVKLFSIGKGVKRIEAVVGREAYRWSHRHILEMTDVTNRLGVDEGQVLKKVDDLMSENKKMLQKISHFEQEDRRGQMGDLMNNIESLSDVPCLFSSVKASIPELQKMTDLIEQTNRSVLAFIVGEHQGQFVSVVYVSSDLRQQGFKAGILWKEVFCSFGGRGGGKEHLAQGKLPEFVSLDSVRSVVETTLQARK